jgi:membrane peptidoglycan carboxypeptidase
MPAPASPTISYNLPPMPPLPLRPPYKPVSAYKQQAQIISVGRKQRPHTNPYALTRRQKLLGHLSRKHLRRARTGDHRARVQFWTAIWTTIGLFAVIFASLGTTGSVTAYSFFHRTQLKYEHQVDTLRSLLPPDNLKIYDSKGVLIAQLADQGVHTTVKLDQVSPFLINATTAVEDKTFWTNEGIDLPRIIRAALDDLRSGRIIEGGSTITQQLIKNLIVGNQTTIIRKLEELVLTPLINNRYSKRDILEMYLNSIYYGQQAYGIDAAATVYFGLEDKPGQSAASQLDLAQSATLAAIPSNPSLYDPLLNPNVASDRFITVLSLMKMQNYITKAQALDAMREAQDPHFFKTGAVLQNRAPHFVNFVLSQLEHILHVKRSQLSRSGISVYTTLDIALQDKIQQIAQRHVAELRDIHHVTNAAEVLIDFHTGAIISLLGSIDFYNASIDGQVDVTQSYRQPGSSFKPYVYVTAFKQGASPAQAIVDKPTTIELPGGNPAVFTPHNYDLSYHGHMTLRCALQNSLNVPAVKVLQHVGIKAAMQTAYNMGITSYQGTPGYSLVLGGLGIRLLDHTSAMGVFANGGVREGYYGINKVVSVATGKVIYQHSFNPGKRVLSPQLAYMMTSVLSDNTSRIPEFSDCNVLQLYSNSQGDCWYGNRGAVRPAAAKTGTTTDFRDNWTVGYTTDYVMGVWVGNDDNSPMIDVTGVQGAAPIWHDAMLVAEHGHPMRNFTNPSGLVRATVTYPDGVQTTDWFLPGRVPTFNLPAPTPRPTTKPTATGTTTLAGTHKHVPNPIPAQPLHVAPYCPSSYSFAFTPPSGNAPGWW